MSTELVIDGLTLLRIGDEQLIRDVDLAERLGYAVPAQIRELIKRWQRELGFIRTVRKNAESRGRPATEFWLTEEQALFIVAKSETPRAIEVTKGIIRVFREAMRQHYEGRNVGGWSLRDLVAKILSPAPSDWEACFGNSLVAELARLDHIAWSGGRHPRHLASTNRKIYDLVFSTEIGRELKARNPEPKHGSNHSQHLSAEAREYFRRQLDIVEAIARGAANKADFWARMERQYGGGLLQLDLGAAS